MESLGAGGEGKVKEGWVCIKLNYWFKSESHWIIVNLQNYFLPSAEAEIKIKKRSCFFFFCTSEYIFYVTRYFKSSTFSFLKAQLKQHFLPEFLLGPWSK